VLYLLSYTPSPKSLGYFSFFFFFFAKLGMLGKC
jgi:hypothetical protein